MRRVALVRPSELRPSQQLVGVGTHAVAENPGVRPKVLVVEDDATIAKAYARAGEAAGYEVILTDNGLQAVDMAAEAEPQVILLDIELPGLDGRDVMAKLRKRGLAARSVVIFVSGRGQQHDRLLGLGLGADDYESKPVSAGMLFAKVGRLLEKKRAGEI